LIENLIREFRIKAKLSESILDYSNIYIASIVIFSILFIRLYFFDSDNSTSHLYKNLPISELHIKEYLPYVAFFVFLTILCQGPG